MSSPPLKPKFQTVLEALEHGGDAFGRDPVITFIHDDGTATPWKASAIRAAAMRFAHHLQADGVQANTTLPIVLPTSPELVIAFFGALYAGAWPSLLGVPSGFGDIENFGRRIGATATHLQARHMVTTVALREAAMSSIVGEIGFIDGGACAGRDQGSDAESLISPTRSAASGADLAIIQCTSGSTGLPKGVMLSHANLLANVEQISIGLGVRPGDVVVSWLPLHHDMGLIGCLLFALYAGIDLVLFSPAKFLRRPATWLRTISDYRASFSPAPNFAYSYVASRTREVDLAGLDLSCWRAALCGAEPIDPRTLVRFQERFAPLGLRENVMLPCYGLAEASLAATFHRSGTPTDCDLIDRDALNGSGEVRPVREGSAVIATEIVSCGSPLPGTRVRIVDADGKDVGEQRAGWIEVSGPSIMMGYFDAAEKTAEVLHDGWLGTGDLGYLREGRVYVTGRGKDVIIIRGKNYAPTDFEWAAEEVPGVRKGGVVAFGVFDPAQGTETLHLVCETGEHGTAREQLTEAVHAHVAARCGIRPEVVRLCRRYAIPRTTSGKLQRAKTKEAYLDMQASREWRTL